MQTFPTTTGKWEECLALTLWIRNENDKNEPFDLRRTRVLVAESGATEDAPYKARIVLAHLPHLITCTNAADFGRNG